VILQAPAAIDADGRSFFGTESPEGARLTSAVASCTLPSGGACARFPGACPGGAPRPGSGDGGVSGAERPRWGGDGEPAARAPRVDRRARPAAAGPAQPAL